MSEIGDRMVLIRSTLATALPARVVTRDLMDFSQRDSADLAKGIYTLVSGPETGYQNLLMRAAMDGQQKMLLVGQIALAETALPSETEDAELAMVDEIKTFLRALPAVLTRLQATGYRNSQQIEHPYGWVAFDLEFIR
jgi:hypothetical protein